MLIEFTAIYKRHPNGAVVAFVAERPDITTGGHTLEEARENLAERLRGVLEFERQEGLALASPDDVVEPLHLEIARPQKRTEGKNTLPGKEPRPSRESDFMQVLLAEGLIDAAALSGTSDAHDDDFEPIPVEGKPISEEIVEGRR
jgi:predicted RNase H-like HicB family nuclease